MIIKWDLRFEKLGLNKIFHVVFFCICYVCYLTFVTIKEGILVCVVFHYFSNLIFITLYIYKGLNQLFWGRILAY